MSKILPLVSRIKELEAELEEQTQWHKHFYEMAQAVISENTKLEEELKHWRAAFPDCSCPDNCLQHN